MNQSDWLTDELILAAFERRAGRAAPGDLRETILTLSAASNQHAPWRQHLRSALSTPVLRPTMPMGIAAATVIGVIAVGAVLFATRPGQPAVGGPSQSPDTTFSPSATTAPSAGTSAAAWAATGGMTEARTLHTATLLLNGKVLVAGGKIGPKEDRSAASAELYDPGTGTWSATGSMHGAREGQTATLLQDGTVLVAGGSSSGGGYASATAELYDPGKGTWTATADEFVAGNGHTATLLSDGKVLVVGGDEGPQRAELYDPGRGTWTATGLLATRRVGHTATLLPDGRVLVVGGGPFVLKDGASSAELYDPNSGTWTATGNLGQLREEHTATLLHDGTVLVTGCGENYNGRNPTAKAELYDPTSGSWTPVGDMLENHGRGCSTTLMADGRVLVAGGSNDTGVSASALAEAELYDPNTRAWTTAPKMDTARAEQTATLLPGGQVLVAGGHNIISGLFSPMAFAELYDPGGGN